MLIAEISVLILVVIWLGYPAVVATLARLRRPVASQWPREDALPSLSVILATREDAAAIARRVENLARVEYPADRVEILVCVDAGTAGGATGPGPEPIENALQRLSNGRTVRIVSGPAPGGKAVTLNAGVAAATGSVLIFADTAQWFEADAFLRLVDRLADPRVAAVSGRLLMADEEVPATLAEWYWRLERRLRRDEARVHSTVGVTGAIYAMRRELFVPFPAGLILDDLYTPMQLVLRGYRVAYADDAIAREPRRFSIADERRRKVRTLTGVWQLCRWLPAVLLPWRNPIWPQFVAHKLLRFTSPVLVLAGMAGVVGEGLLALRRPASVPVLAVALGGVVVLAGVGPARRILRELLHLNLALLQATRNGLRGRWQVW